MTTYHRTCKQEYKLEASNGVLHLETGKEYITSRSKNGKVMVFTNFWVWVPTILFGKPKRFT